MSIDAEINNYLSRFSEDEKLLLLDFIKKISSDESASIGLLPIIMNWKRQSKEYKAGIS